MKLFTIFSLSLLAFNAFGGSLYNLSTGEQIDFALNKETNSLEITSTAFDLKSKHIGPQQLSVPTSELKLLGVHDAWERAVYKECHASGRTPKNENCYIYNKYVPPFLSFTIVALAIDG